MTERLLFKFTYSTIFLLLLCSCASRQEVHIFSKGVSIEEVSRVSAIINKAGLKAQPNKLEVPSLIGTTSIMYPPIVKDFASIERLRNLLKESGYSKVALISSSQGGHSYSTEHIGLYLVDPILVEE